MNVKFSIQVKALPKLVLYGKRGTQRMIAIRENFTRGMFTKNKFIIKCSLLMICKIYLWKTLLYVMSQYRVKGNNEKWPLDCMRFRESTDNKL